MKNSLNRTAELLRQNFRKYLRSLKCWFSDTPERALLEAYQAAQRIKNIESEHFDSNKISLQSVKYTENVMSYWQVYLNKNLTIIKIRLAEFQLSRGIINISNPVLLEKLKVIDEVVEKYAIKDKPINHTQLEPPCQHLKTNNNEIKKHLQSSNINEIEVKPPSQNTRVAPSYIGRKINKIKANFAPQTEEEFVRNYRTSKSRTLIAFKFLMTLVIVPLLAQSLSKEFIVIPILERVRGDNATKVFLNSDMEKEALHELHNFQEELRFEYLLNQAPPFLQS